MAQKTLDIGQALSKGWELFQANLGLLVVASIISSVVGILTVGILSGAMAAGMLLVVRRLVQADPVQPVSGDVFKGIDFFVQAVILVILAVVTLGVLVRIPVVNAVAGLAVGSVLSWALMFVVFERLSAIDAVKKVINLTKTGDFTIPLVMAAIACVLSALGGVVCCVGGFFTGPIACCAMVCAYESLFGGGVPEPALSDAPPYQMPPDPPSDLRL